MHSSHTPAKQCSKFSKRGLNSMWTENLQIFKRYLEKAEESEIKLPTSVAESSRKTSTSASLTMLSLWLCGSQQTGKFLKRWEYQTTLFSWETCMQGKKQQFEPYIEQLTSSKLGKEYIKVVYCHPAYLTSMKSTS